MTRKQQLWFTSDWHCKHRNILTYSKRYDFLTEEELLLAKKDPRARTWRPSWESIERMEDHLINITNELVHEDDILWNLGDVILGPRDEDKYLRAAESLYYKIKCKNHYLINGNHDGLKHNKELLYRVFQKLVVDSDGQPILDWRGDRQYYGAYKAHTLHWKGVYIELSHYAHAVWHRSHRGSWMICGHSHGSAEPWLDKTMPGRRSMDVGIDNVKKIMGEYRPISFDEISNIFADRKGCSIDHHVG